MEKITFWNNSVSIHQGSMIAALASLPDHSVDAVTFGGLSKGRRAMGWEVPDHGKARLKLVNSIDDLPPRMFTTIGPDETHIFSGFRIRGFPEVHKAMKRVMQTSCHIGVIAESPDPRGTKGILRRLLYRALALAYGRRIDFILAAGTQGRTWFEQSGFQQEKIFEFGYFFDPPPMEHIVHHGCSGRCRIIFMGSLIQRKGVDILLTALAKLKQHNFSLEIIGDGIEYENILSLIHDLNLTERVTVHGFMSNKGAMRLLSGSDLLVLPSRFDGWGAVVNEALIQSVYVIASDSCGSSSLLDGDIRGQVFRSGDAHALSQLLRPLLNSSQNTSGTAQSDRQARRSWAVEKIGAASGAKYLSSVIEHIQHSKEAPIAPWRQE